MCSGWTRWAKQESLAKKEERFILTYSLGVTLRKVMCRIISLPSRSSLPVLHISAVCHNKQSKTDSFLYASDASWVKCIQPSSYSGWKYRKMEKWKTFIITLRPFRKQQKMYIIKRFPGTRNFCSREITKLAKFASTRRSPLFRNAFFLCSFPILSRRTVGKASASQIRQIFAVCRKKIKRTNQSKPSPHIVAHQRLRKRKHLLRKQILKI